MAEISDNVNILSRFTKLPDKNQATVLFVGVKGIGKHRIARSMLGIHTDFSLQIRVATSLPLPEDTENTRPRIDFIVLFIDLTNNLRNQKLEIHLFDLWAKCEHSYLMITDFFALTSLETIKSSIKHIDIDYFLGHCCFVVTQAKNEAMHAVSIQEVTSLVDSYDLPLICADLQKEEDRKFLSQKLVHLLQVSCGFCADVTTLLLDTTRKSFVFEDELSGTME